MNISDRIVKGVDSFTVSFKNNGYLVVVAGRDDEDDWVTLELVTTSFDQVVGYLEEVDTIHGLDKNV